MIKLLCVSSLFILISFPVLSAESSAPDPIVMEQIKAAIALRHVVESLQALVPQLAPVVPEHQTAPIISMPPALPIAPIAPIVISSPPVPVVVSTEVSIPSEIRDGLISVASILIPAMFAISLSWMRKHLKIMQEVGMNQSITESANGFAALLVNKMRKEGESINTIDVRSPQVASYVTTLLANYPDFATALKLTPDKASILISKGVAAIANVPAPNIAPDTVALNADMLGAGQRYRTAPPWGSNAPSHNAHAPVSQTDFNGG